MPDTAMAGIGHNQQPLIDVLTEIVDGLPDRVRSEMAQHLLRTKELSSAASEVPSAINTDEEEKLATDILAQLKAHEKSIEAMREGLKQPTLRMGKIIDGVAKSEGQDPLVKEINRINPGMTAYKRKKEDIERRRREEEARLAREAAERARREQEEAERKKREAEEATRRAEQDRLRAEEEKRRAEQAVREAKLRQEREEAEARLAAERRKQAEKEEAAARERAAEAKKKADRERAEREAADAKRRAEEQAAAEEAARKRAAAEAEQRAEEKRKVEEARAAEEAAKAAKADAKAGLSEASQELKTAATASKHADGDAYKASKAADEKTSKLTAQRGDYGGHTHLQTRLVAEFEDPNDIPAKTVKILWEFVTAEEQQMALNKYLQINKDRKPLPGVRFYHTSINTIRS